MVKTEGAVWGHFKKTYNKTKKWAVCKYCKKKYQNHADRMIKHLVLKCKQTPEQVKREFGKIKCSRSKTGTKSSQDLESQQGGSSKSAESGEIKPNKGQIKIIPFLDSINRSEKETIDRSLARAFFANNIAFSVVENKYFRQWIQKLRPSYAPPGRITLSTALLQKEFDLIQSIVGSKIQTAEYLGMMTDSWTDINGICLTNILFTTPEPVFYRVLESKTEAHTANYLANILTAAIEEVGSSKVKVLVSDNAANMRAAWVLVKNKHPHILTYGCVAHCYNLLAKEVAHGLKCFSKVIPLSKRVTQFFKNKHIPRQVLREIQHKNESKETALKTLCETRWSSLYETFESILQCKNALQVSVIDSRIRNMDTLIRKTVLDEDSFWPNLEICVQILKPIAIAIKMIEGDLVDISRKFNIKKMVEQKLGDLEDSLSLTDFKKLTEIVHSRHEYMHHDCELAAYILNPKEFDKDLISEAEMKKGTAMILQLCKDLELDQSNILTDLGEYISKTNLWASELIWDIAKKTEALTWWRGYCFKRDLSKIAALLLSMPATSAACERNWKNFSLSKTKLRNRLTVENTTKLVTVRFNLKYLDDLKIENFEKERAEETFTERLQQIPEEADSEAENGVSSAESYENSEDTDEETIITGDVNNKQMKMDNFPITNQYDQENNVSDTENIENERVYVDIDEDEEENDLLNNTDWTENHEQKMHQSLDEGKDLLSRSSSEDEDIQILTDNLGQTVKYKKVGNVVNLLN